MSKKLYEQPTTKVLVVRVEGSILTGSPQWSKAVNVPGEIEDEDNSRTYGF